MKLETRNYIAGEWLDGESTVANINPSDLSDVIGHFAQASAAQLNDALAAARQAQPLWERTSLEKRQTALMGIGQEMMARADLLKSSDEDLAWLNPEASPEEFCEEWGGRGVSLVVVTCGGEGAVLRGRAGLVRVLAPQIEVADTVGAGDTFQAGLLTWLQKEGKLTREALGELTLEELQEMGAFAAAAAAITCSRAGCNPPFLSELTGAA